MSVARINQFQAQAGKGQQLRELLLALLPEIQKTDGCESAQLLVSNGNPERLVMLEVWSDIESHQKSVRNIPADQVQKLMALVAGPPKGGFYNFT